MEVGDANATLTRQDHSLSNYASTQKDLKDARSNKNAATSYRFRYWLSGLTIWRLAFLNQQIVTRNDHRTIDVVS